MTNVVNYGHTNPSSRGKNFVSFPHTPNGLTSFGSSKQYVAAWELGRSERSDAAAIGCCPPTFAISVADIFFQRLAVTTRRRNGPNVLS